MCLGAFFPARWSDAGDVPAQASLVQPDASVGRAIPGCTLAFEELWSRVALPGRTGTRRRKLDPALRRNAKPGEEPHPLFWFGGSSRPEYYILTRSEETLMGILVDGEW